MYASRVLHELVFKIAHVRCTLLLCTVANYFFLSFFPFLSLFSIYARFKLDHSSCWTVNTYCKSGELESVAYVTVNVRLGNIISEMLVGTKFYDYYVYERFFYQFSINDFASSAVIQWYTCSYIPGYELPS